MAGLRELLSPYLKRKLAAEEQCNGGDSAAARIIRLQYLLDQRESDEELGERDRHYYATSPAVLEGTPILGVERLYKRVAVIMPTNVCAAHCRWCLRARYGEFTLSEAELRTAVKYCNSDPNLYEVLISGGDPLMTPRLLGSLLQYIAEDAPNIRVVRIASRVPLQAPERISEELIGLLGIYKSLRIELGIHINHASELFPEVKEALERLQHIGLTVYCQSVLLKGLNDSQRDLAELYDELRRMRIEPHYLFHAVPMKGMGHHRTSLNRGLQLAEELVNSGEITGRAKPMYTAMTDVGKITLYDGVVLERKGADVLLQSAYSYESRREWNPRWVLPPSAFIDPAGKLRVWYLDGVD